ncbi:MAG TPA: transglutaminase family protein [Chitinophagaceae bacterium]|nr:MAG: hypothetical protein UZ11_BCD004001211 [Bacteroidetes bacterium OLB11]HMN32117.1 transglutaminase family protein [Chitinophagaceae bacterium]
MQDTKEINALFQLLDDPDKEIFETVSNKIIHFGKDIIPNLESFWEHNLDSTVQERIEAIIHKVHFNDLYDKIKSWLLQAHPKLLDGVILLAQYRFVNLDIEKIHKEINRLHQNCWLELNQYLTALEQVTIINKVMYSMNKFLGKPLEENNPNHFFVNEVLESKHGNIYSLGAIYQIVCEMLDVPVCAIQIPAQHILAYIENYDEYILSNQKVKAKIQFYVDANTGDIYTQNDIDVYLKKYQFEVDNHAFLPLSTQSIFFNTLEALLLVYQELDKENEWNDINTLLTLRQSE